MRKRPRVSESTTYTVNNGSKNVGTLTFLDFKDGRCLVNLEDNLGDKYFNKKLNEKPRVTYEGVNNLISKYGKKFVEKYGLDGKFIIEEFLEGEK